MSSEPSPLIYVADNADDQRQRAVATEIDMIQANALSYRIFAAKIFPRKNVVNHGDER